MKNKRFNQGFTLIELIVAIAIFAIISVIAYRIISALVITKNVITETQNKWGDLTFTMNRLDEAWSRAIPLVIRDASGAILPAFQGKNNLSGNTDAQLEFSLSGIIGDSVYGPVPPQRIGFRFINHNLYLLTWPVLNRVLTTSPQVNLLLSGIDSFQVSFLNTDQKWYDNWPLNITGITRLPQAFKIRIQLSTKEEIVRQWALK